MEKAVSVYIAKEFATGQEASNKLAIFTDIFDSYYPRVYNYIRYRLPNIEEAEELTSQVFEQVVKKYATFDEERGPIEVWLLAIAQHTVIDYYRYRKRRQWWPLDQAEKVPSLVPGPDELAIQEEERTRLLQALQTLGERERNIIAMKFAGGLKNRDIARLTGISESNIGVIIHRSLHKLHDILKEGAGI